MKLIFNIFLILSLVIFLVTAGKTCMTNIKKNVIKRIILAPHRRRFGGHRGFGRFGGGGFGGYPGGYGGFGGGQSQCEFLQNFTFIYFFLRIKLLL